MGSEESEKMTMKNYYFTFSQEGQLYEGGWVRVVCESMAEARRMFAHAFGDSAINDQGLLRCAGVYAEKEFLFSGMLETGNYGEYEHAVIEKGLRRLPSSKAHR